LTTCSGWKLITTHFFKDAKEKVIVLLAGDDGECGDDGGGEGDGESITVMAKQENQEH